MLGRRTLIATASALLACGNKGAATASRRIAIPVIEASANGSLDILRAEPIRARALIGSARRRYSQPVLQVGDRISSRWLQRTGNPYAPTIRALADELGEPGVHMLNLSYEWACTSIAAPDPDGIGCRLLRTLDWPFDGLGANVVVGRERGPAGSFFNVTWPGNVGILTAMAPGRFSVALNQAPMASRGFGVAGDWMLGRMDWWRSAALPPAHLLRHVVETAPDFEAAVTALTSIPLSLPCFYIVAGIDSGQACVIERLAGRGIVHVGPIGCANDWLSPDLTGRARGRDNAARRVAMECVAAGPAHEFDWVVEPILNRRTRVAVAANARAGVLSVVGIERDGPATEPLRLAA